MDKLRRRAGQQRRGLRRIRRIHTARVIRNGRPGENKRISRVRRHGGWREVVNAVRESGEWHGYIKTTALFKNSSA